MGEGSFRDLSIAATFHVIAAAFDKGDFVVPPHDVAPVNFVVFLELLIELQVLTDAHNDVLRRHTWVGLVSALIPLAVLEVEGAHAQSHVDDCSFLGRLVFNFDTSQLCVLVSGHQKDSALSELLKQVARSETILVSKMSESTLLVLDQLHLQG